MGFKLRCRSLTECNSPSAPSLRARRMSCQCCRPSRVPVFGLACSVCRPALHDSRCGHSPTFQIAAHIYKWKVHCIPMCRVVRGAARRAVQTSAVVVSVSRAWNIKIKAKAEAKNGRVLESCSVARLGITYTSHLPIVPCTRTECLVKLACMMTCYLDAATHLHNEDFWQEHGNNPLAAPVRAAERRSIHNSQGQHGPS